MNEWRLIEENSPEPDWLVLTLWDGVNNKTGKPSRYYEVALWDGESGNWVTGDGDVIDTPTHWMPLPDPPIGV